MASSKIQRWISYGLTFAPTPLTGESAPRFEPTLPQTSLRIGPASVVQRDLPEYSARHNDAFTKRHLNPLSR